MPTAPELGVTNVQEVLEVLFGVEGKTQGREYLIPCPNPGHNDQHPSCSVNLETGLYHCLSCGIGGDLIGLGVRVLDETPEHVQKMFKPHTIESLVAQVQRQLHNIHLPSSRKVKNLPGPYSHGPYVELRQRGFSSETIERWGIRWVVRDRIKRPESILTIGACFALPVRDSSGRLLAWLYRRTNGSPQWQPKYLETPGFKKSSIWYGCHMHPHADHIVIAEGPLDAMWLDQCGVPALGALGNDPTAKIKWLKRYKRVFVLGDRDVAGVRLTTRIGEGLKNHSAVYVMRYSKHSKAKDPQEMTAPELHESLARAVPYMQWAETDLLRAGDMR